MLCAKIGAIPHLFTANINTTDHAVRPVHQLVATKYIAIVILHAGFAVIGRQLFGVQQQHIRTTADFKAADIGEPEEFRRFTGQTRQHMTEARFRFIQTNFQRTVVAIEEGHVGDMGAAVVKTRNQFRVQQQTFDHVRVFVRRYITPVQVGIKVPQ